MLVKVSDGTPKAP